MSGNYDDDDWHPPTESEMKVLAAKRERSDKISKLMGDYLLKGYKMLATVCHMCSTIELQDRQGQLYCVACMEVDCHETSKDNPALSEQAADQAIAESAYVTISDTTIPDNRSAQATNSDISSRLSREPPDVILLSSPPPVLPLSRQPRVPNVNNITQITDACSREQRQPEESPLVPLNGRTRADASGPSSSRPQDESLRESLETSLSAVVEKLCWASRQLGDTENLEQSLKIVSLVKQCADTVVSLRTAIQS